MTIMRHVGHACAALVFLPLPALAASAHAPMTNTQPATASTTAAVAVHYDNPDDFSENRLGSRLARPDNYLDRLKQHIQGEAQPMLDPGETLQVTVTDVELAGQTEPGRRPDWDHIRIMRDVYPPHIDLHFRLDDAEGDVVREGTRQLRGLGYLHDYPNLRRKTDPLRYEKALLDDWLHGGPSEW